MLVSEVAAVPWPALLVAANGAVLAASPSAVALLGFRPSHVAAVESRFEFLSVSAAERMLGRITRGNDPGRTYDLKHPNGEPLSDDELPSTRVLRDEAVINLEVLIERHRGGRSRR